jgi:hypothetical protein
MYRILLWVAVALTLTACGAAEPKWAPEDQVQAARYVHDGPPTVTLYTVLSTRSGNGAHTGLMVNADERVMFDPAGTWQHPRLPERNDVHYGMSPKMVNFYIDYHARETYDVVEQTIVVSPAIAALVKRRMIENGAVPKTQCSLQTSKLLRGIPGFESLPQTWQPKSLMEGFARLPGVTTRKITDDDADNNHGVLLVQAGDPALE